VTAYATSVDYTAYAGGVAPSDVARLLDRASDLIDSIVTVAFAVDAVTKLPTDAAQAAALSKAACAQVEFWQEVGESNDVDGLAGTQVGVFGFSGKRAPRYAPRMLDLLRSAGLLGASSRGGTPWGTGLQ
jgi:hypothetical protein